jgi:hypothetical protein
MPNVQPSDLRSQHQALVQRVVLLRTAIQGLAHDHTDMRRQLARVRAENRVLRTAQDERQATQRQDPWVHVS